MVTHPPSPWWDNSYVFQLAVRGCKRFLRLIPARKLPITPSLLLRMALLFDMGSPLHAAMWAFFLVTVFLFLRKSNIVLPASDVTSPKVPRRLDLHVSPNSAFLHIRATKTIQFFQRARSIPLPIIPFSVLCPVTALINHLRLNSVRPSDSLFSVRSPSSHAINLNLLLIIILLNF